jgi:hypothetical protein
VGVSNGLNEQEAQRFRRDGAVFPIRVFSPDEINGCLAKLEAIELAGAGRLPHVFSLKPHLLTRWLWDMVHDPRIVIPVTDLLGPDVLCWASSFFNKSPASTQYVAWHQDWTYWGLSEPKAVTAWVAFTPSRPENGCLRIIPGTHRQRLAHRDTFDPDNMLFGREETRMEAPEAQAIDVVLEPGEMSLHDLLVVHGSEANRSGPRRVGFAIRYIAGNLIQVRGERGSATLVHGRNHGHFDMEQPPEADFHPDAVARHRAIFRRWMTLVTGELKHSREPEAGAVERRPTSAETAS